MNRRTFIHALALGTVAPSLGAGAQPATTPSRIGWLAQGSAEAGGATISAFREGLRQLGYAEGRQYLLEARYANGRSDRLPGLAAELAALPVDVIVAPSTPSALAAMEATRTIPIVMVTVADPVGSGLIRSFARPGANVTGTALALDEVSYKWLELLKTVRGHLSRVAVIHNSTNRSMPAMLRPLEASARALNVALTLHDLTLAEKLASVFDGVAGERPDGLVVLPDALLLSRRAHVVQQVARMRVLAIYGTRLYVEAGGLMSYGADFLHNHRRAASYIDKILKGAQPGDLPVERPTKFELVINIKTAKALGLTIPPSLLLQAESVIE
jgi:putative ABC transport system substrate-binding protein